MAFTGPSSQSFQSSHAFPQYRSPSNVDPRQAPPPQFDILEWYPQFQSCHRYFLDHAQHSGPVQALAAFINIQLPFQKQPHPVTSSAASSPRSGVGGQDMGVHLRQPNPFSQAQNAAHAQAVSLIPYIRRLVATGHDTPGVLHGFFGDDWVSGVGSLHEIERRNFLFAAKSSNWLGCKQAYDVSPEETVPFLSPLKDTTEKELKAADAAWGEWIMMQDWELGPREPPEIRHSPSPIVKREPRE